MKTDKSEAFTKLGGLTLSAIQKKIAAAVVGTVIVGGTAVTSFTRSTDKEIQDKNRDSELIQQSAISPDFFSGPTDVTAQTEITEPATQAPKVIIKYVERPPKITKENMFQNQQNNNNNPDKEEMRRRLINSQRRQASGVMVANPQYGTGSTSTQKFWDKTAQDKSSYPVDTSRVITADKMISCLLIQEIISDVAGQVTCQVEENIYGSKGRLILIPAGSKVIGRFQPLKRVGDTRLVLYWDRIITPQGISINTTKAELTDQMGRTGGTGKVDNRYTEKYGLALLMSTVTSAASYSIPVDTANQQIIVGNYTKDLSGVTNQILNEQINIKPRITIPAGTRIFVNPVVDIWFPLPKNGQASADIFQQ